eukprot:1160666-Pelagomonas_calceolata.AAC.4
MQIHRVEINSPCINNASCPARRLRACREGSSEKGSSEEGLGWGVAGAGRVVAWCKELNEHVLRVNSKVKKGKSLCGVDVQTWCGISPSLHGAAEIPSSSQNSKSMPANIPRSP